jgi:hypothetical protein
MRFLIQISWDVETGKRRHSVRRARSVCPIHFWRAKAEAAYFKAEGAQRAGVMAVNIL